MIERSISDKARIIVSKCESDPHVADLMQKLRQYSSLTFTHCINVAYLAAQITYRERLEKSIARQIVNGAMLHDIGKMNIPIEIIEKPEPLTDKEYDLIKNHPEEGIKIIEKEHPDVLTPIVRDIILYHHERPDGSGYPTGIRDIPEHVRLISVIDSYDAITSERPYNRKATSLDEAIELLSGMGFESMIIYKINECKVK